MVTKVKDHSEFQYWCPRVQKNKKWKFFHSGNRSYQLTNAGQYAHDWQIGRHWLAGNSDFLHQRIFIFWFSEPLGINIEGSNFLSKSTLTCCESNLAFLGLRQHKCNPLTNTFIIHAFIPILSYVLLEAFHKVLNSFQFLVYIITKRF